MNDSRAHLSWCAELSRSTDAHQARLGRMELLLLLQAAGPTPRQDFAVYCDCGQKGKSPGPSNNGRLPQPANIQSPRQNKAGAADLASIVFVVFDLASI